MKLKLPVYILILLFLLISKSFGLSPVSSLWDSDDWTAAILEKDLRYKVYSLANSSEYLDSEQINEDLTNAIPNAKISPHKYLCKGNILGLLEFDDKAPGAILVWSKYPPLNPEIHSDFAAFYSSSNEYALQRRHDFEKLLLILKINYKKDSTQTFYYIEDKNNLQKLETFYKKIEEYNHTLLLTKKDKYKEEEILKEMEAFKELRTSLNIQESDFESNLVLWNLIIEQLRRTLIPENIPIDLEPGKINIYKVDAFYLLDTNLYNRISNHFREISSLVLGDKIKEKTDPLFSLFMIPSYNLLEFSSLISDWKNKSDKSQINYFYAPMPYSDNILNIFLLNTFKSNILISNVLKRNIASFKESFNRDTENYLKGNASLDSSYSNDLYDFSRYFQSLDFLNMNVNTLMIYAIFISDRIYNKNQDAQHRDLLHIIDEPIFLMDTVKKVKQAYEKHKEKFLSRKARQYDKASLEKYQAHLKKLDENFARDSTYSSYLKSINAIMYCFRTTPLELKNYANFLKTIGPAVGPEFFYLTRLISPDHAFPRLDKKDQDSYLNGLKNMEKLFSYEERPAEKDKLKIDSGYDFLTTRPYKLFNIFFFWNNNFHNEKVSIQIDYLTNLVNTDPVNGHLAAAELAYFMLLSATHEPDTKNKKQLLYAAKNYFIKSFTLISDATAKRQKQSHILDSGFINDSLTPQIPAHLQETNVLINFIYILFFQKEAQQLKPTLPFNIKENQLSFALEKSVLNEIIRDIFNKKIKDIDWDFIMRIIKFKTSFIDTVYPLEEDMHEDFIVPIEAGMPDEKLNDLLSSYFNDYNKFSLIFAYYIQNYFDNNPAIKKQYPESYKALKKQSEKKPEEDSWVKVTCLAHFHFGYKRFKDGYFSLSKLLDIIPELNATPIEECKIISSSIEFISPETIKGVNILLNGMQNIIKYFIYEISNLKNTHIKQGTILSDQFLHDIEGLYSYILESTQYKNGSQIERNNLESVVSVFKSEQYPLRYTLLTLLQDLTDFKFDYEKPSGNNNFTDFIGFLNNKLSYLEQVALTVDRIFSKLESTSPEILRTDLFEKDWITQRENIYQIIDFLKQLKQLNQAAQNKNFLGMENIFNSILNAYPISLEDFIQSPQNQNLSTKQQKNSSKQKQKKKKKEKQKDSALEEQKAFFAIYPEPLQKDILSFLQYTKKAMDENIQKISEIRKYLQVLSRQVIDYKTKQTLPQFLNLKETISNLQLLQANYPFLFESNIFNENEEEEYYKNYQALLDDSNNSLLIEELKAIEKEVNSLSGEIKNEINSQLKERVSSHTNIKNTLSKLWQLRLLDNTAFENTLKSVSDKFKDSYKKMEESIAYNLESSYDYGKKHPDHNALNEAEYFKLSQINFLSGELLKSFHEKNRYSEVAGKDFVKELNKVQYKSHAALVIQELKIIRLGLSAKYNEQLIRLNETQEAFRQEVMQGNFRRDSREYKEYNQPLTLSSNKDLVLSIASMPTFLYDQTSAKKKFEKAKRIFKKGDRLIFYSVKEEELKGSKPAFDKKEGPIPVLEIKDIILNTKDPKSQGDIILSLTNPEDFPPDISLNELLEKYIPAPKKGIKTFFLIKKSFDIRDRFIFFDKLITDIISNAKGNFNFEDSSESIQVSASFSNSFNLNGLLGLVPMHMKHQSEMFNHTSIIDTARLNDVTEEQNEIFKRITIAKETNPLLYFNLVEAPGGTGKTYFTTRMVKRLLENTAQISVTAPTHRAVDVIAEGLSKLDLTKSIARIGSDEAAKKIDSEIKRTLWDERKNQLERILSQRRGVLLGTSTGFKGDSELNALITEYAQSTGSSPLAFDYTFYDESGNDSLENFIYFIYNYSKPKSFSFLFGDVLQLSPFGFSTEEVENILNIFKPLKLDKNFEGQNLNNTLFSQFFADIQKLSPLRRFHNALGFQRHFLTRNFRSLDGIVELLNRVAYNNNAQKMTSMRDSGIPKHEQVIFIENFKQNRRNFEELLENATGQYINKGEIFLLLTQMKTDFNKYSDLKGSDISFISPYKAQNQVFTKSLWAFALLGQLNAILNDPKQEKKSFFINQAILSEVNELIRMFGKKTLPNTLLKSTNLTEENLRILKNHLLDNLPYFIPKQNDSVTIDRIFGFNTIDITDPDPDITTVHKIQGGENRAIYFSAVRANDKGKLGFMEEMNGPRMLTVAFGRAKDFLRVAADPITWKIAGNKLASDSDNNYNAPFRNEASFIMTTMIEYANELKNNRPRHNHHKYNPRPGTEEKRAA